MHDHSSMRVVYARSSAQTGSSSPFMHFIVSSGAVTVNEDSSVQILAEEAAPLSDFDIAAARSALDKAQAQLSSAGTERAKAEASVAIEVYEALVKALEGN